MLEKFQSLTNHLGLVPMMITRPFAPYDAEARAAFPPDEAERLYARHAAVPLDADGNPIAVARDVDTGGAAPAVYAVEIPDDWETIHHLQRNRIARELRPDIEGRISSEEANAIIAAEVAKRR